MNSKWLLLFVLCICQLTLSAAFTPEEARRVFDESSLKSFAPSVEVGDYLFTEVKWKVDVNASAEDREAEELSATLRALRKCVLPETVACTNSPFGKALTTWLLPEPVFDVPEVMRTVVCDEEKNGFRRMVLAFDAPVLKAAKVAADAKARQVNERTGKDWLASLKVAAENFRSAEEKRKFNVMLGCPIVNFIRCPGKYVEQNVNDDEKDGVAEVEKIVNWVPAKGSVFLEYPGLLWSAHKSGESNLFYPSWREDDGGRFAEAEGLYLKGKDIPKILCLLAGSIRANPIGEKKWQYLGGVLKAMNKYDDAIIAYIQALKFNQDNAWAWKGVRDCCRQLGMKSNAAGLEWYFKLNGIK